MPLSQGWDNGYRPALGKNNGYYPALGCYNGHCPNPRVVNNLNCTVLCLLTIIGPPIHIIINICAL